MTSGRRIAYPAASPRSLSIEDKPKADKNMKKPPPSRQKPAEILSRYTSLPVLLDLIERQSLVFLNPQSWQDRNDSLVME